MSSLFITPRTLKCAEYYYISNLLTSINTILEQLENNIFTPAEVSAFQNMALKQLYDSLLSGVNIGYSDFISGLDYSPPLPYLNSIIMNSNSVLSIKKNCQYRNNIFALYTLYPGNSLIVNWDRTTDPTNPSWSFRTNIFQGFTTDNDTYYALKTECVQELVNAAQYINTALDALTTTCDKDLKKRIKK